MQTNVMWNGVDRHSLEDCRIAINGQSVEIDSIILGQYEKEIFRVEYRIKTDQQWRTRWFEIKTRLGNKDQYFSMESDGLGNWNSNGRQETMFNECLDIDISLTPFTNTLPINRLNLAAQGTSEIQVVYVDVLNNSVRPARQKYSHVSGSKYKYENIPNDFDALISVDEQGLVIDYPSLFNRLAIVRCNSESPR